MDVILSLLQNVLEEGFIYGIVAMGVYITYKILDFPDLSVDGTFPLGCAVTAAMIVAGVNPWLACIASFVAGALAGCVTGLLHVRLRVTDLLSGIIVMTACWSVNLIILGANQPNPLAGNSLLQFYNQPTIFTSFPMTLLPDALYRCRVLILAAVLAIVGIGLPASYFYSFFHSVSKQIRQMHLGRYAAAGGGGQSPVRHVFGS